MTPASIQPNSTVNNAKIKYVIKFRVATISLLEMWIINSKTVQ